MDRAPVQNERDRSRGWTIPWAVHLEAWEAYVARYGNIQSAERIAERGGFGAGELDDFVPGWRKQAVRR